MVTKIGFKNYKLFKQYNELEIKPITILFGKNSSGKSSITKFLHVFFGYLNSNTKEFEPPIFSLNYNDVEIGAEFRDLISGRMATGFLEIILSSESNDNHIIFSNESRSRFSPVLEKVTIPLLDSISRINQYTYYLGPLRQEPQRSYNKQSLKSDSKGLHTYQFLINEAEKSDSMVLSGLSSWFSSVFEGWSLIVNTENTPIYTIEIKKEDLQVNICDTGYGISQVLPIAVSCFLPTKKDNLLLIFEQPELHIHPAAHGDIAELFVNTVKSNPNKRILIETHSQNLILRIRKLIADRTISHENVSLNFIDFDEEQTISTIQKINIDEYGKVDFWPPGIFEESYHEAVELRRAQKEREENNEVHH